MFLVIRHDSAERSVMINRVFRQSADAVALAHQLGATIYPLETVMDRFLVAARYDGFSVIVNRPRFRDYPIMVRPRYAVAVA